MMYPWPTLRDWPKLLLAVVGGRLAIEAIHGALGPAGRGVTSFLETILLLAAGYAVCWLGYRAHLREGAARFMAMSPRERAVMIGDKERLEREGGADDPRD
jgi:hypothetical protein